MLDKKNIAVVGLGAMGFGAANALLSAGHDVWGFDVAPAPVERFMKKGGKTGALTDVAKRIDIAVVVVLNDVQTETVLFGTEGIVSHMKKGAVVVACATVSPQFARKMAAACENYHVHYLDAPISGGAAKSAKGELSILASGCSEAFLAAKPALDAMAEMVFELGDEIGAGSAMKAVNQMLAGIHIVSMAEALTFGISQGIEPARLVEVISKCAGSSWMFENRAPHVVGGDYTPHSAVNIWPKDLGIVLEIARQAKFSAPMSALALQQFLAAAGSGLGKEDDAAVAKVYARNANLSLPGSESDH